MPKNKKKPASTAVAPVPPVEVDAVMGRPWFDGKSTVEIISKCKSVWAIGGTDTEAACYAEISIAALNRWLAIHPEDKDMRDRLKETPILKARQTVVNALEDPAHAWRYLEHKRGDEFANRPTLPGTQVNITFNQELEQRAKKYEPTPVDIEAKVAPPNVGAISAGPESIPVTGGGIEVHQANTPT